MLAFSSPIMNIAGSEWIIIILVALLILFGAKKLPQVSRTVGRAVGEYEKARNMFRREMEEASEQARGTNKFLKITGPVATEREKLEKMADSLGIGDYISLTDEQLRSLISKRIAS
jgi:sec-independent protein translocase protein TatA